MITFGAASSSVFISTRNHHHPRYKMKSKKLGARPICGTCASQPQFSTAPVNFENLSCVLLIWDGAFSACENLSKIASKHEIASSVYNGCITRFHSSPRKLCHGVGLYVAKIKKKLIIDWCNDIRFLTYLSSWGMHPYTGLLVCAIFWQAREHAESAYLHQCHATWPLEPWLSEI